MRRCAHLRLSYQLRFALLLHAFVTDVIERPVASGLKQVRLRRAVLCKRLTAAPQLEHNVLHYLFGNSTRVHNGLRRSDERGIPLSEDRVECSFITLSKAIEEVVSFHCRHNLPRQHRSGLWKPHFGNRASATWPRVPGYRLPVTGVFLGDRVMGSPGVI